MSEITIKIEVDYREKSLYDKLSEIIKKIDKNNIILSGVNNLHVGDINILVIGMLGQTLRQLLIERKTYSDLIASIKDGRYKEQKLRLKSYCQNNIWASKFMYLIETTSVIDDKTDRMFYGSLISMIFRDNIPVVRVLSIDESCNFIIRMSERLLKDYADLIPGTIISNVSNNAQTNDKILNATIATDNIRQIVINKSFKMSDVPNELDADMNNKQIQLPGYNSKDTLGNDYTRAAIGSIKTKKGDNMTRELCHNVMLSNIPGISGGLCRQILQSYDGSICNLINSLMLNISDDMDNKTILVNNEDLIKEKINKLSEIPLMTSTGKTRKLGPVLAQRIWDYLGPSIAK